jgi:hypothetical protein
MRRKGTAGKAVYGTGDCRKQEKFLSKTGKSLFYPAVCFEGVSKVFSGLFYSDSLSEIDFKYSTLEDEYRLLTHPHVCV